MSVAEERQRHRLRIANELPLLDVEGEALVQQIIQGLTYLVNSNEIAYEVKPEFQRPIRDAVTSGKDLTILKTYLQAADASALVPPPPPMRKLLDLAVLSMEVHAYCNKQFHFFKVTPREAS